jgi:hypothetical protein
VLQQKRSIWGKDKGRKEGRRRRHLFNDAPEFVLFRLVLDFSLLFLFRLPDLLLLFLEIVARRKVGYQGRKQGRKDIKAGRKEGQEGRASRK